MPATFTVTSSGDAGLGSLRAAIEQANLDPAPDTIGFSPSVAGTISLASGLPILATDITIRGPGPSALAIDGSAAPGSNVLHVGFGGTVRISGLTLTGGRFASTARAAGPPVVAARAIPPATISAFGGSGIYNLGVLSVVDSVIAGNRAAGGAGVYNIGVATISRSIIANNASVGAPGLVALGGGILSDGTLTLSRSVVQGNTAAEDGGGIYNVGLDAGHTGTLTIANSTIANNAAAGFGGGIVNAFGSATITNSTIANNSAARGGGGIDGAGPLSLAFTTVAGNVAPRGPGLLLASFPAGPSPVAGAMVVDSLFANAGGNITFLDLNGADVALPFPGAFASLGHNLFSDAPSVTLARTDLVNANPRLGPLANYGGATPTLALRKGSPAIDAGAAVAGVTTDQRGSPRPRKGTAPDIGAFESQGNDRPQAAGLTVARLRRFGFHEQPTSLVLTFSAPLDPARARDLANYRLVDLTNHNRPIPIGAATYDPSGDTVTLEPARRLRLSHRFRLTVRGRPPLGVAGIDGTSLSGGGRPGTNFVRQFGRDALAGSAADLAGKRSTPPGTSRDARG